MKFVYGFLTIGIGVLLVLKTEWLVENFGRFEWAEEHLGAEGGTRIFWKLFGVTIIFFAFLAMMGAFNAPLNAIFGKSFNSLNSN
ncbi:MAG: hypothetical protein V1907_04590 [Candidatus Kerfeldbacteria bacterium]